jgi:hypothetical protein
MMRRKSIVLFSCVLAFVGTLILSQAYAQSTDLEKKFVGKKTGDLLDYFEIKETDLLFHDEPPGKLRSISFAINKRLRMYVHIEYSPDVFSEKREWDYAKVRSRPIRLFRFLVEGEKQENKQ